MDLVLCNNCGKFKSRNCFYSRKDGTLRRPCRECVRLTTKLWRERNGAHQKNYYQANRERVTDKWKRWYECNKENRKKSNHRYYQKSKDQILSRQLALRKESPDKHCEMEARRRARKLDATSDRISRVRVFKRDKGICHICGKSVDPINWHLDHIVPLAKGGKHTMDNVAVSHPVCNLRKSDTIMEGQADGQEAV